MSLARLILNISIASFLLGAMAPGADAQDRGDRGDRGGRSFGGDSGGGGFWGGPPGGFGGGPPGGFGGGRSMLDTNGDGTIDQEELDRMPSFVRDMMQARGVELKAGMSVDDMRNTMRASFGASRDNNGPQSSPNNGSTDNSNPASAKPVLKPYIMKPKPALIEALPPAYSEVDTNFDGQLGLDEWMLARRTDLNQFDEFDIDHDGFLIPDELKAAEVAASGTNAAMAVRTEKLTIVNATPKKALTAAASGNNDVQNQGNNGSSRWSSGSDIAEQAKSYFPRLDRNQDGFIDEDEFQQSRRTRGMFEQAGIPLQKMSLEQFTENLQKATNAGQSNGGR